MSNLGSLRGTQQPGLPTPPQGDVIAQYRTYLDAQKAVDYLSDHHFPVQAVTIVGVGLQMVERVTGRLTYARVALAGLASGAWFGLFVGLLISLFGSAQGFSVFAAIFIGAAFGLLFGLMSYALTGGRRDFTSTSQIVASEYRLLCMPEQAGQASQLLNRMAGEGGPRSTAGPGTPASYSSGPAPYQGSALGAGSYPGSAPTVATPTSPEPARDADRERSDEPEQPPIHVSGPTYGEMIDRKRREQSQASANPPDEA
jgi:hypothetical protein